MKKIIIFLLVLSTYLLAPVHAQRPHQEGPRHEKRPDITEMVGDLSAAQKGKLETITNESKKRIETLRKQQKSVRDSIHYYMDMDGDQSKYLYPLFDREARIQTQISREMYVTKVHIDQVLTKEQRKELKENSKRQKKQRKGRRQ